MIAVSGKNAAVIVSPPPKRSLIDRLFGFIKPKVNKA
jgi:hypothetical protein